MRGVRRLVTSPAGETITETLVSVLIAALAIAGLVTSLVAAARISRTAEERASAISSEAGAAGEAVPVASTPRGTVTLSFDDSASTYQHDVVFNGVQDGDIYSYTIDLPNEG